MEQYIIRGGNPLVGDVTISGAKNTALRILAASVMADDDVMIDNLPDVRDINVLLEAVQEIGVKIDRIDRHTIEINGSSIGEVSVDDEHIRRIHASYCFIGAFLGKYKSTQVPLPGGCNIGSKPIDQHIKRFGALGTEVTIERGAAIAHAIDLVANRIYLDVVSVGATVNIMVTVALAEGQTILENTAKGPHIVDTASFLSSIGANIKRTGTDIIRVRGVNRLRGTEYSIVSDQIEADTFMCTATATRGDIMVKNVIPKYPEAISIKLTEIGYGVIEFDNTVRMVGRSVQRHTDIKTLPYPGFPTDIQPQMSVTLVLASGAGVVIESIFESRFKYVDELACMGSSIKVEGNVAVVDDVKGLTRAQVNAPGLRTGAALMIVGLAADGYTVVDEIGYTQRGYECSEEKLQGLRTMIKKVDSDREVQELRSRVG